MYIYTHHITNIYIYVYTYTYTHIYLYIYSTRISLLLVMVLGKFQPNNELKFAKFMGYLDMNVFIGKKHENMTQSITGFNDDHYFSVFSIHRPILAVTKQPVD